MSENEENPSSIGRTVQNAFEHYSADDWDKLMKSVGELMDKSRKTSLAEKRTLSIPVFALIAVIIVGIMILTWLGIVDGQYITSIGSVIVGYLLSFLGDSFSKNNSY